VTWREKGGFVRKDFKYVRLFCFWESRDIILFWGELEDDYILKFEESSRKIIRFVVFERRSSKREQLYFEVWGEKS